MRDGEESAAGVEMWVCRDGVKTKVVGEYKVASEEETEGAEHDSEGEGAPANVEKDSFYVEVVVTRGRDADCIQDGKEHDPDKKLLAMFADVGWREIKGRELFILGRRRTPALIFERAPRAPVIFHAH
jgi:hypothetical protein